MKNFSLLVGLVAACCFLLLACSKEKVLSNEENQMIENELLVQAHNDVPEIDEAALAKEAAITPEQILQEAQMFRSPIVEVPAGSHDALADAIAQASNQGIVWLRAGEHYESSTVMITKSVKIIGEPGAKLIGNTQVTDGVSPVEPMIHVKDTRKAQIWGLEILPQEGAGGTGVLIENSPFTFVRHNRFRDLQYAVLIEKSNSCRVFNNSIVSTGLWLTGEIFDAFGVVNINGANNFIAFNEVSNSLFGIWACSKSGVLYQNRTHDNYVGIILCNVPEIFPFVLPSGGGGYSLSPANHWLAKGNNSRNNFSIGYLVIDGANHNVLKENRASGNGNYDYELTTDTYRFGFLTPAAHDNVLYAADGQSVKNCGPDNEIYGGALVDTEADPCN